MVIELILTVFAERRVPHINMDHPYWSVSSGDLAAASEAREAAFFTLEMNARRRVEILGVEALRKGTDDDIKLPFR